MSQSWLPGNIYGYLCLLVYVPTIASKINVTPKCVHLSILTLHSILAAANLLAHNNISQICYCGQISLQSAAFFWYSDSFGGTIYFAVDGTYSFTHVRESAKECFTNNFNSLRAFILLMDFKKFYLAAERSPDFLLKSIG